MAETIKTLRVFGCSVWLESTAGRVIMGENLVPVLCLARASGVDVSICSRAMFDETAAKQVGTLADELGSPIVFGTLLVCGVSKPPESEWLVRNFPEHDPDNDRECQH